MIVAIGSGGEAFKVSPRNRVLQRFVEQSTLTFQFLQVVAQGEVFKVFAQDRVHQLLHQWIVLTLVMELLVGFSHFSRSEEKCGVRQPVRRSPARLFFT